MEKRFICNGNKYEIGGLRGVTIGLPVNLNNLPEKIEIEGNTLLLKTEFHVSLICFSPIMEKYKVYIPDFIEKITADFCEFVQNNDINLLCYRDGFRFAARDERRSVIVMCDVSNLDKFFELINKKYNLQIEYPPTHVTLYALQDRGIYLTDSQDIQKLTKLIFNPIGISL